jgi:predicted AlkP superfamily pyrophosphatase or phosphodiesterase
MRNRILSSYIVAILLTTLFLNVVESEFQDDPPVDDSGVEQKVLIIGIDGVRGDVAEIVAQRNDSAFGRIKENGAWSFNSTVGPYAISGPGWSSMLTGVWCDRHGVVDNSFHGSKHSSVPNIFEIVETHDSNMSTAAVYWWEPIGEEILSEGSVDVLERFENDELVRDRAVELLTTDSELDVLFVSIDNPDAVGHHYGFSPEVSEYVAAVKAADDMTTEIMDALEQRNLSDEDWLIIITSDHGGGGRFLQNHYPSEPIDKRTFMLVTGGSTVAGEMTNEPVVVDVVVTALTHLEIPLPEGDSALDGRTSAFTPSASPARTPACDEPAIIYQVDEMIVLVIGGLSLAVISFSIVRRKRRQNSE